LIQMSEWTYSQGTGVLRDPQGNEAAVGYSGNGEGLNNCEMQNVKQVGPIPQGLWVMGSPYNSKNVGPYAIPLKPVPLTNTYGRSAFLIHGDNNRRDRSASHGCIILPRKVRNFIVDSGVKILRVTP
jgi:hypothetical protein